MALRDKIDFIRNRNKAQITFVIGTGRSGTHWLGYTLAENPGIRTTIESKRIFKFSTRMALNASRKSKYLSPLIRRYQWQLLLSAPKMYLDKSHTNMWIATELKTAFPNARFLGIERNPYSTVASMIVHKQVSAWHRLWRQFPVPNPFLGITEEIADSYDSLSIAQQCALRWKAHHEHMNALRKSLGSDLLVISYEEFAANTGAVLQDIDQFLGLKHKTPLPEVKRESLDKWKNQLSQDDIRQIEEIVGFPPDTPIPASN